MIKFYNNIEEIYRLSVILKEFCKKHEEIAEISQISVLAVKEHLKRISLTPSLTLSGSFTSKLSF